MRHDPYIHRPGTSVFFTVSLKQNGSSLLVDQIDALRAAFRQTMIERPFYINAIVVLPDHLHAALTFPPGDLDYSNRWTLIKSRFLRGNHSNSDLGNTNIWERRNWEHHIKDRNDLKEHVEFCLSDPVRHGYVSEPTQWQYSSIHRDLDTGIRTARYAV